MIYIVEDDSSIRELVVYTLRMTGYGAAGFPDAKAFFEAVERERPELVLLDIMLPGEDGIAILKRLRADRALASLPVMMVTAKGSEYDKVTGLDCGADDYITKPFGMMELVSRIRALLRRAGGAAPAAPEPALAMGPVRIDIPRHTVTAEGAEIPLTLKEYELLKRLMEHGRRVLTRDQLLEAVWGYDFDGETRTVDVHIRSLRRKLGRAGELIQTVRGVGYRMDAPDSGE